MHNLFHSFIIFLPVHLVHLLYILFFSLICFYYLDHVTHLLFITLLISCIHYFLPCSFNSFIIRLLVYFTYLLYTSVYFHSFIIHILDHFICYASPCSSHSLVIPLHPVPLGSILGEDWINRNKGNISREEVAGAFPLQQSLKNTEKTSIKSRLVSLPKQLTWTTKVWRYPNLDWHTGLASTWEKPVAGYNSQGDWQELTI